MTPSRPSITSPFIDPALSIYLDLWRFLAAVTVLIGHAGYSQLFDGWQGIQKLAHESVILFFVLSGLVIAQSATKPGMTACAYFLARASRLYSVVLPAILFSYCLVIGYKFWAGVLPQWLDEHKWWTPFASLLFLNESWQIGGEVPWNGPFWSLCYEAFYYLIFGCALFLRGYKRYFCVTLAALVAGPAILLLLPVWLMGVALQHWGKHIAIPAPFAALIVVLTASAFIWFGLQHYDRQLQDWLGARLPIWRVSYAQRFITDYGLGLVFAIHLLAIRQVSTLISPTLNLIRKPIQFLASFTFSIYLFHRPMTHFLAVNHINVGSGFFEKTALLVSIILACMALGYFTERKRPVFERAIARLT